VRWREELVDEAEGRGGGPLRPGCSFESTDETPPAVGPSGMFGLIGEVQKMRRRKSVGVDEARPSQSGSMP
jgi:hypothetical protein